MTWIYIYGKNIFLHCIILLYYFFVLTSTKIFFTKFDIIITLYIGMPYNCNIIITSQIYNIDTK